MQLVQILINTQLINTNKSKIGNVEAKYEASSPFFYNFYYLETFTPQINQYVLAAIPVVVIGAPLGAYFCAKVRHSVLMAFLLMLIALEVSFTIFELLN